MRLIFAAAIVPLLFSSIDGQAGEIFDEMIWGKRSYWQRLLKGSRICRLCGSLLCSIR